MLNNRLSTLIARKLAQIISEEESLELDALLKQHPRNEEEVKYLEWYWQQHNEAAQEAAVKQAFEKVMLEVKRAPQESMKLSTTVRTNFFPWKRLVAAAIILGALIGTALVLRQSKRLLPENVSHIIHTKNGKQLSLTLEDGTLVHLNAASKLTYPDKFSTSKREVWLVGEAYFDVAGNADKPFIIHTPRLSINVLGTAFNVKAYPHDPVFETTLLRGAIEIVLNDEPTKKILLKPNEKFTFENSQIASVPVLQKDQLAVPPKISVGLAGKIPVINADSMLVETSWLNKRLVFKEQPFGALALQLERWYDVEIVFKREELKGYIFSGSFVDEPIEKALAAMQLTEDFKFEKEGHKITIY